MYDFELFTNRVNWAGKYEIHVRCHQNFSKCHEPLSFGKNPQRSWTDNNHIKRCLFSFYFTKRTNMAFKSREVREMSQAPFEMSRAFIEVIALIKLYI